MKPGFENVTAVTLQWLYLPFDNYQGKKKFGSAQSFCVYQWTHAMLFNLDKEKQSKDATDSRDGKDFVES
jgi:hypothetical protein